MEPAVHRIDFSAAGLPEYKDCYAIVLDNLFSKEDLSRFLAAAEASSPWDVARVNAGSYEFLNRSYRNGQRIIYDDFDLSDEIFSKIRPHLADIERINPPDYKIKEWKMVRMNERLRFLRYPPGGFFRRHTDGAYATPDGKQQTFYTVQLYLPSSADGSEASFQPAQGGTTRFMSRRTATYIDVDPIPGRVLVFQHDELLHTGEEVTGGIKVAVRCDILYEKA